MVLIVDLLDLQMKLVNLRKHALLLITCDLDLLDQIFSSNSFFFALLYKRKALVRFNDFPFTLSNDNLILLPLSN